MYSWILNTHDPISQALAADFLLFMAGVFGFGVDYSNSPFYAYNSNWGILGIPAKQSGTTNFIRVVERHWHTHYGRYEHRLPASARIWRDGYCLEAVTEAIETLINSLSNMEMVSNVRSEYLGVILREELAYFVSGNRTAVQTATRLQNKVTAYIMKWISDKNK